MPAPRPPRLLRRLLTLALPADVRDDIDGDQHELYVRRVATHGAARARLWYGAQALSFSARFLVERLRAHRSPVGARRVTGPRMSAMPSGLDVRLALRMLLKYPGLSVVSVVGLAVAIAIGAGAFSIVAALMGTTLPLPEGDRLVSMRNALVLDPGSTRATLDDYVRWRDGMTSVRELSAFTNVDRNLAVPGATVELVRVARMTASGFGVARVAPLLGRTLLEADERQDARVVVIGYDEWQRRFAADPQVVGRELRLGRDVYTIVGVMPEGFRFPVDDRYWIPLHFGPQERERPDLVPLTVFGRLADGATIERAAAEAAALQSRGGAASAGTRERVRPQVLSYTRAFFDIDGPETERMAGLFRIFVSLLLVVVAVNVAILVYARTATRAAEIAVRTALGASRTRVVTQLFAEALALSLTAAVLGLAIAGATLARLQAMAQQGATGRRVGAFPFWIELGLSPTVVVYAFALAVVGAAIIGVVPALQATGRRVHTNLQRLSGQGTRMELGRAWTALIVGQVAIAVAVLPFAAHFAEEAIADASSKPGYPIHEFLQASITLERTAAGTDSSAAARTAFDERFRARAGELLRRLANDPAVAGVSVRVRGDERVEIEELASTASREGRRQVGWEGVDHVDPGFLALHEQAIVAGRAFTGADVRGAPTSVIVNEIFAENQFGRSAVVGRRLRFVRGTGDEAREPGPWLEIVGVVRDFQAHAFEPRGQLYLPADITTMTAPVGLVVRTRAASATEFMPRLRALAAGVDPELQLDGLASAAASHREIRQVPRYLAIGTVAVMLSGLLLSAAGIYAMMSFTVTRRRREIGIRSALGAEPGRVLRSIFARASAQLGGGLLLGLLGTIALDRATGSGPVNDGNPIMLLVVAALMTAVGLLAAIGPARRGLAVEPTEALRAE